MKIDKSWYVKPKDKNFPRDVSAGGVVLRFENEKMLIGLIKDPQFSDYLLRKGRSEKGENFEEAAKREIAEETGIYNLTLISELGIKERLTFKKNEWRTTHYFLFLTTQKSGTQDLQEDEDYTLEWFDFEKLPPMFWPEQKELIEENHEKIKRLIVALKG